MKKVLKWIHMKNLTIALIVLALLGLGIGVYFMTKSPSANVAFNNGTPTPSPTPTEANKPVEQKPVDKSMSVLGTSVEGRNITAYHFGEGTTELLFVGGIQAGYEWNTVLLAYQAIDYLKQNPNVIPKNIKVTVIPVLNPDGLNKVVTTNETGRFAQADVSKSQDKLISGRFNANNVDLGRNFDCDWQSNAKWQNKTVSGGSAVFSEPESKAFKNYIEASKPAAVVVWYSSVGGVFSSNCHNGILPETKTLTATYAKASGYKAYGEFNFYETTGDVVNWLAKINIPAISVLLTNHEDTEWTKNQAGIDAVLKNFAK